MNAAATNQPRSASTSKLACFNASSNVPRWQTLSTTFHSSLPRRSALRISDSPKAVSDCVGIDDPPTSTRGLGESRSAAAAGCASTKGPHVASDGGENVCT